MIFKEEIKDKSQIRQYLEMYLIQLLNNLKDGGINMEFLLLKLILKLKNLKQLMHEFLKELGYE